MESTFEIALVPNQLRQPVNVRCKRTDQTYSGDIVDVLHHVLYGALMPLSL